MLAIAEKRICKVPYDTAVPVDVFFDLGHSDSTAIWFRQRCGFEWHYIKYYSNSQKKMGFYLEYLAKQPYRYGTIWLPHDAKAQTLAAEHSIEQQVRKAISHVENCPSSQS